MESKSTVAGRLDLFTDKFGLYAHYFLSYIFLVIKKNC